MTRMHSTGRVVVRVLCIAGLLVLGYVIYVVVDAKIYQPIEHRQLEKTSPSAVARAIGHPAIISSCRGAEAIQASGVLAVVASGLISAAARKAIE